jgi:hypothetical protein
MATELQQTRAVNPVCQGTSPTESVRRPASKQNVFICVGPKWKMLQTSWTWKQRAEVCKHGDAGKLCFLCAQQYLGQDEAFLRTARHDLPQPISLLLLSLKQAGRSLLQEDARSPAVSHKAKKHARNEEAAPCKCRNCMS